MISKIVALAGAGVALAQGPGQRVSVSFDLGWRVTTDLNSTTSGTCNTQYPTNLSGWDCHSIATLVPSATTSAACQAAACVINADMFAINGTACYIGPVGACTQKYASSWISYAKNGTQQPWNPPASQPGYDDSLWAIVDVPHDYEITGFYNKSANKGEAFLPYGQAFYRKYFSLPAEWKGQYIEVHIEGALSVSSWWINGVQVVNRHTAGYIPIVQRLDNVPGAPLSYGPGSSNVLVAFVDGSETTGWWCVAKQQLPLTIGLNDSGYVGTVVRCYLVNAPMCA